MLNLAIPWVEYAQTSVLISLAFYLFYVVGVMALPITIFPIIGGVLFPFWIALPLNLFAATAGAWLSFMVTRKWGKAFVGNLIRKKIKSWEKFSLMEGFKTVLLLRLVGVPPFIVANYGLGLSGVRQSDFITGTLIGILPWMAIITYLSHSFWQAALVGGEAGLTKALAHAMGPLVVVSFSILGVMILNYFLKRRRHSNL